jgi:hypothetical protein
MQHRPVGGLHPGDGPRAGKLARQQGEGARGRVAAPEVEGAAPRGGEVVVAWSTALAPLRAAATAAV